METRMKCFSFLKIIKVVCRPRTAVFFEETLFLTYDILFKFIYSKRVYPVCKKNFSFDINSLKRRLSLTIDVI